MQYRIRVFFYSLIILLFAIAIGMLVIENILLKTLLTLILFSLPISLIIGSELAKKCIIID